MNSGLTIFPGVPAPGLAVLGGAWLVGTGAVLVGMTFAVGGLLIYAHVHATSRE